MYYIYIEYTDVDYMYIHIHICRLYIYIYGLLFHWSSSPMVPVNCLCHNRAAI